MRSKEYKGLRYHLLHEMLLLRAKKRVHGMNVFKEVRATQKLMVKLRKDNPLTAEKTHVESPKLQERKRTRS